MCRTWPGKTPTGTSLLWQRGLWMLNIRQPGFISTVADSNPFPASFQVTLVSVQSKTLGSRERIVGSAESPTQGATVKNIFETPSAWALGTIERNVPRLQTAATRNCNFT